MTAVLENVYSFWLNNKDFCIFVYTVFMVWTGYRLADGHLMERRERELMRAHQEAERLREVIYELQRATWRNGSVVALNSPSHPVHAKKGEPLA